jgi:hypothetical protein
MLELKDYVVTWDDTLAPGFCESVIRTYHDLQHQQQRNGRNVRPGLEDSAWTELNVTQVADDAFKGYMEGEVLQRFEMYKQRLGLSLPISPVRKLSPLIMKRYAAAANERFQLHFDSLGEVCNRYLVFLWYLNDVAIGGETEFPDLGLSVAPRAGRMLMFPPYWMYQHVARPPQSNDKYIISCYALY